MISNLHELKNNEKKIVFWFADFVKDKFKTKFVELTSSSDYNEYKKINEILVKWSDIENRITHEQNCYYPDKFLISRLSDKTHEWRGKWQRISILREHFEKIKSKIWYNFCKDFSQELEEYNITTHVFKELVFNPEKCEFVEFAILCFDELLKNKATNKSIIENKEKLDQNNRKLYGYS